MKIIDSHIHLYRASDVPQLNAIRENIGVEKMSIASIINSKRVNDNAALHAAKAAFPGKFYTFPALDHAEYGSGGKIKTPSFLEQLDQMVEAGADGLKLLESKPTHRLVANVPVDSDCYEPMFAKLEETGFPVLWHVADPEEFWNPETTPGWATANGWGYDSTWTPKESFYAEVDNVLNRHPKLQVTFPHFYFLSADLPRLEAMLDRFSGMHIDLAPGIEMLYNLSKDPKRAREFFIKHADRIVFGTDIEGDSTLDQAAKRAGIVTRWLESEDEYRVPDGADISLGPAEDGVMRGMKLPEDVLQKIYVGNFESLAGSKPKPLNRRLAKEECERLAREIDLLGGDSTDTRKAIEALG